MKLFNPSQIRKILCIKPRGIGDIILSTIILENLKNYFPDAEIYYLTEEFAKEAIITHPLVKNVITFTKKDSLFSLVRKIRKEKFDLIFDLWSNPKTAQVTFLSGARFRVGFAYRGRSYAYNLKSKVGRGENHSAEHNLELLKACSIPIVANKPKFYLNNELEEWSKLFINKEKKYLIGIIPSGGWNSKRCPKEKWLDIIEKITDNIDSDILILWGPEDKEDADYLYEKFNEKVTLAPETSLLKLAALISKCDLIIANDSGPMHLAAALDIPTIGLFGPTDPKKHGPYSSKSDYVIKSDLHCIICNKLECPFNKECFNEMDSDIIVSKSIFLLSRYAKKN